MMALERAKLVYESGDHPRTFEQELAIYMQTGHVFIEPHSFLMAKPINTNNRSPIDSPWIQADQPNCWWINLVVGRGLERFIKLAPYALPFVAWARTKGLSRGRIRVYKFDRLRRLICPSII